MTIDIETKFYTFVKTTLILRRWTVNKLAKEIGYPRRTVSAAINGTNYPYVIQAIAKILNHDTKTDGPIPFSPARPEERNRQSSNE